jgi:hypothetical protein
MVPPATPSPRRGERSEFALRLDRQLGRDQAAGLEAEQMLLVGVEHGAGLAQEAAPGSEDPHAETAIAGTCGGSGEELAGTAAGLRRCRMAGPQAPGRLR